MSTAEQFGLGDPLHQVHIEARFETDRPSRRKVVTRDDRQSLDQFRRVSLTRDDRHIAVVTDDVEGNLWTIRDR